MAIVSVQQGQNLFDIAIENYGTVVGVNDILLRNPHLFSLTQKLYEGDPIEVADEPIRLEVRREVQRSGVVATDDRYSEGVGIGYSVLGDDFTETRNDWRLF